MYMLRLTDNFSDDDILELVPSEPPKPPTRPPVADDLRVALELLELAISIGERYGAPARAYIEMRGIARGLR